LLLAIDEVEAGAVLHPEDFAERMAMDKRVAAHAPGGDVEGFSVGAKERERQARQVHEIFL
jgi:hypothetical protein